MTLMMIQMTINESTQHVDENNGDPKNNTRPQEEQQQQPRELMILI